MKIINYSDFLNINICVGTILSAEENNFLKNPSIILRIDFGKKIGIKKSSAQLLANYKPEKLLNKQIIAVVNFPQKQIGNIISEVLVLGLHDNYSEPVLVSPDSNIENGMKLL